MKKTKLLSQKGFTLIELLVVIAIIGILSAIALASLNSARNKAADAAIKANMASMDAQAALYYDDTTKGNGSYGAIVATSCSGGLFTDPNVTAMITQAKASTVGGATLGTTECTVDTTPSSQAWAITIGVLKGANGYWCADSAGHRVPELTLPGSLLGVCK